MMSGVAQYIVERARTTYGLRLLFQPGPRLIVVYFALAIVLAYRLLQLVTFTGNDAWAYDFSAYWTAARNLLTDQPIYAAHQLAGPYSPQEQLLYLYPPLLAALLVPLAAAFEGYRDAFIVWFAMGLGLSMATVIAVARAEGVRRSALILLLIGAALAMPPVVAELAIGNVHLVLLGLLAVAWLGVRQNTRGGEVLAGAAVALATLIKIFPGVIVLWFLLQRRTSATVAFALGVVALVGLSLPLTGVEPWIQYPRVLLNLSQPIDVTDTLAPTVWLSQAMDFTLARVVVTATGLAILTWAALRRPVAQSFAVAVLVSVMIAPALYHHYLAITVLPFLLAATNVGISLTLALAYLSTWGGSQTVLGDVAWIVNRALPTLGSVALLYLLVRRPMRQAGAKATGTHRPAGRGHSSKPPNSGRTSQASTR